jgi:DNA-binding NarL/FixJ family response regulator
MHHERPDGMGYYRGLAGAALPFTARLLAAAVAWVAMTSLRPHRPARPPEQAVEGLLGAVSRGQLDGDAARAVLEAAGHPAPKLRAPRPAGLSEREIEVLRLIARGATHREVGRELVISPRTAAHHIQHIYDKIGVSTRAAAAMFAMEHGVV